MGFVLHQGWFTIARTAGLVFMREQEPYGPATEPAPRDVQQLWATTIPENHLPDPLSCCLIISLINDTEWHEKKLFPLLLKTRCNLPTSTIRCRSLSHGHFPTSGTA